MTIKRVFLLFVGLLLFDLSTAFPQPQSVWLFQQPMDSEYSVDLSFVNLLSNIMKPKILEEAQTVSKCYREDIPTIDLNLYYESLCPDCVHFVLNELYPTYQKLKKYINLKLFPYGNTRMETDNSGHHIFTCQHGKTECLNDNYQACLLDKVKDQKKQLELVKCLMGSKDPRTKAKECLEKSGVGPTPSFSDIERCVNGEEGYKLMYDLAIATQSLKPPHEYAPWVTFNGEHSWHHEEKGDKGGLESYLCNNLLKEAPECKQQNAQLQKYYREDDPATTVLIEIYYEPLCGGCMDFIINHLHPVYMELKKYLRVKLYPYGNTLMSKNLDRYGMYVFSCQHGIEECVNNLFQACLLNRVSDTTLQVQLVSCLMGSKDPHMKTKECMQKFNVNNVKFDEVDRCVSRKEGNWLMYRLSKETASLNPPHHYAPWVTIDKKHSPDAEDDLKSFLCKGPLKDVDECKNNSDLTPNLQIL